MKFLKANIVTGISPSIEVWKKLYRAAIAFQRLHPWDWMWDRGLFGVQNPDTGQIGYCCVMGRLGEHFALAVYRGSSGLAGYVTVATSRIAQDSGALLSTQNCLMVSFEDRQELDKKDLQIIKQLGLQFRGQRAWPMFRSYEPGKLPWFITADEASWLTYSLVQTIQIAKRLQTNPESLQPKDHRLLVRTAKKVGDMIVWEDEWKTSPAEERDFFNIPQPDQLKLQKIKDQSLSRSGIWEVDYEYSMIPVRDKHRPYFPVMFLAVHQDSGFILNGDLEPAEDLVALQEAFIKTIEQSGIVPEQVLVKQSKLAAVLEPIAKQLNFGLSLVKRLNAVAQVRRHMAKFFLRRKF